MESEMTSQEHSSDPVGQSPLSPHQVLRRGDTAGLTDIVNTNADGQQSPSLSEGCVSQHNDSHKAHVNNNDGRQDLDNEHFSNVVTTLLVRLVREAAQSHRVRNWRFQPAVMMQAQNTVTNQLMDEHNIYQQYGQQQQPQQHLEQGRSYSIENREQADAISGSVTDHEQCSFDSHTWRIAADSVHRAYHNFLGPYRRWRVISRVRRDPAEGQEIFPHETMDPGTDEFGTNHENQLQLQQQQQRQHVHEELERQRSAEHKSLLQPLLCDLLLLYCVFVEADIARSQNNLIMLLYHTCRTQEQTLPDNHVAAGELIRREIRFLFRLMSVVGFRRDKHNQSFFCWDDINALCSAPQFVRRFLDTGGSLLQSLRIRQDSAIHSLVVADEQQQQQQQHTSPSSKKLRKRVERERRAFVRHWKTYIDRTGGPVGLLGYMTVLHTLAPLIYPHLGCLFVGMFIVVNLPDFSNIAQSPLTTFLVCSPPLMLMLILVLLQVTIGWWWNTGRSGWMAIPGRSSGMGSEEDKEIISAAQVVLVGRRKMSFRHRRQKVLRGLYNHLLIAAIAVTNVVVFCLVLLDGPFSLAHEVIAQGASPEGVRAITVYGYVATLVPLLIMHSLMPTLLYTLFTTLLGFAIAVFSGSRRFRNWANLASAMRQRTTLFELFQRKVLSAQNAHLSSEQVAHRFALYFNALLQDMFDDHLCTQSQRDSLSFRISDEQALLQEMSLQEFDLQVRRITSTASRAASSASVPAHKNKTLVKLLVEWINSLHMSSLPDLPDTVECMPRLNIVTPVFDEPVVYSWSELISSTNTDTCLLRHVIERHSDEWRCFYDHPNNVQYRPLLQMLELRLMGSVYHPCDGDPLLPKELQWRVRMWASRRYQAVARTVKGLGKTATALKLLLRVQTLHKRYSEQQLDSIVRSKFRFILGAQRFHSTTWPTETTSAADRDHSPSALKARDYLALLQESPPECDLVLAYQRRRRRDSSQAGGQRWEGVLLGKKDPSRVRRHHVEELSVVNCHGRFDTLGHGKPTHQAFLMQFVDGTFVQTIDSNQDAQFAQLVFMRNLMQEFPRSGGEIKILGIPEDTPTKSWSLAGYGAARMESILHQLMQRAYSALGTRVYYGHPDVIDARWAMFTTGLSKLSYVSEDVMLGIDTLINGGRSAMVFYSKVCKTRDVSLLSTTKFNRKIGGGAAQMALSRYYRELIHGGSIGGVSSGSGGWLLQRGRSCFLWWWRWWVSGAMGRVGSRHRLNLSQRFGVMYSTLGHYQVQLMLILLVFISIVLNLTLQIATYILPLVGGGTIDTVLGMSILLWSLISQFIFVTLLASTFYLPDLLALVLQKGLRAAVIDYFLRLRILMTSIYTALQMPNQAFSFHRGFIRPPGYIPSGRGAGLTHESIGTIVCVFDRTHLLPGILFLMMAVTSAGLGQENFLFIGVALIGISWIITPFILNRGSLPLEVGFHTWTRLFSEDMRYVLGFRLRRLFLIGSKDIGKRTTTSGAGMSRREQRRRFSEKETRISEDQRRNASSKWWQWWEEEVDVRSQVELMVNEGTVADVRRDHHEHHDHHYRHYYDEPNDSESHVHRHPPVRDLHSHRRSGEDGQTQRAVHIEVVVDSNAHGRYGIRVLAEDAHRPAGRGEGERRERMTWRSIIRLVYHVYAYTKLVLWSCVLLPLLLLMRVCGLVVSALLPPLDCATRRDMKERVMRRRYITVHMLALQQYAERVHRRSRLALILLSKMKDARTVEQSATDSGTISTSDSLLVSQEK